MKKILFLIISFVLFICSSCAYETKLEKPINLRITKNVLTWDNVPSSCGYSVMYNGKEYIVDDNILNLEIDDLKEYEITVKALGDGKYYNDSEYASIIFIPEIIKLQNPELSLNNGYITWEYNENAEKYKIKLQNPNGEITYSETTECSFMLPGEIEGLHIVSVMAVSGNCLYSDSDYEDYNYIIQNG